MKKKSKLAFELHDDVMHKYICIHICHSDDNARCKFAQFLCEYIMGDDYKNLT